MWWVARRYLWDLRPPYLWCLHWRIVFEQSNTYSTNSINVFIRSQTRDHRVCNVYIDATCSNTANTYRRQCIHPGRPSSVATPCTNDGTMMQKHMLQVTYRSNMFHITIKMVNKLDLKEHPAWPSGKLLVTLDVRFVFFIMTAPSYTRKRAGGRATSRAMTHGNRILPISNGTAHYAINTTNYEADWQWRVTFPPV